MAPKKCVFPTDLQYRCLVQPESYLEITKHNSECCSVLIIQPFVIIISYTCYNRKCETMLLMHFLYE